MNETIARLGTFFFLIGAGLIILFITSYIAHSPKTDLLIIGLIAAFIGNHLRRRAIPPPQKRHFSIIRKLLGKRKKDNEIPTNK
jgi:hypothetical protein